MSKSRVAAIVLCSAVVSFVLAAFINPVPDVLVLVAITVVLTSILASIAYVFFRRLDQKKATPRP